MKEYSIVVNVPDEYTAAEVAKVIGDAAQLSAYRLHHDDDIDPDVEVHFGTSNPDISISLIRVL
jgi:hypothetical protein